jgi:hypothetical protein
MYYLCACHGRAGRLTDMRASGDVGGQKTLRTYWKNYFEKTDTLIWVVDATDRERIDDCRHELEGLLLEEVRRFLISRKRQNMAETKGTAAHWSEFARVQEQE